MSITCTLSFAQNHSVSGIVKDSAGEPLMGVSIREKGADGGTITDLSGKYSLTVGNRAVLVFSYVGYVSKEVATNGRTVINVTLAEDNEMLDEVVVVGYGTVKKRDLTGAVQSVKAEDIVATPVGNVMEALRGKVAGLLISRTSGQSGAEMNMTLRGSRSINGSNTPLFIIDGVEGNYEDLNPNDVQSIEVLKDASSTAIYGSAGANGVIIITTKSGQVGKPVVNFDAYYGINGFLQFPAVNMGEDYIALRREANRTTQKYKPGDPESNLFSNAEWQAIQDNKWIDWFDLGTRNGALQNYSASVSSGTENTKVYFSIGYHNEQGILVGDDNTRYSVRANIEQKISNWFKAGLNFTGAFTDRNRRKSNYFTRVMYNVPLGEPYDANGNVNFYYLDGLSDPSPIADTQEGEYVNNSHILGINPTLFAEITPIKGLSFKTVFSSYLSYNRHGQFLGMHSFDGNSYASKPDHPDGRTLAIIENTHRYNYKWENILNYTFNIAKDHNFVLTGVTSWSKNQYETSEMRGYDIDANSYSFYKLDGSETTSRGTTSSYKRNQKMSYVGRINYSYKGRYLLSLSNRIDGSSMLAEGHKWDNFPAAAIGWRISDESFMKNIDVISNLKLRLGYGVTGNAGAEEYATQTFGTKGTNLAFQETPAPYYMYSANIANPLLGWEKSYNYNVGVDLDLFKGRISLVLDYYRTNTKDILFQRTLPASLGGSKTSNFSTWQNVCATLNRGVEIVLNTHNIQNKNITWSSTLTFTSNHEEITDFTSKDPVVGKDGTYLMKGYPILSYYDYRYLGIWQESEKDEAAKFSRKPGEVKIENINNDSQYTTADRTIVGSPIPKWTLGLNNNITYKNFDLGVFIDVRWGQTMNYGIFGWYSPSGKFNSPALIDYWTPENPDARFPRPSTDYERFANLPTGSTSLFYIDGSYIKLRNVSLGYTLPKQWMQKIGLTKARIYATGSNLFTWTKSKYLKDYDPERGGADEFPLSRQLVFGLNVQF